MIPPALLDDTVAGEVGGAPRPAQVASAAGNRESAPVDERIHERLLAQAPYYDFFYTVGMLERLTPGAARVGGDGPADQEAIRFGHDPSLGFSSGDVTSVRWVDVPQPDEDALLPKRRRYHVTTSFLGLTGSATPIPLFMAEELLQAQDQSGLRKDFLDLFHHRLVSLVYRLGTKFEFSREYSQDGTDPWTRRILALGGIDAWSKRPSKHLPPWRLARLTPLLAHRVRSARVIELAVADVCGEALEQATVRVVQFAGGWVPMDVDQRTLLQTRNSILGRSSMLGVQCFHRASRAVIMIEPLGENFRRFLVDGDMYPVILELLELLCPEPIEFELDLVLADNARPPFLLGVIGGQRVGTDTWLSSRVGPGKGTHLRVPIDLKSRSNPAAHGCEPGSAHQVS